MPSLKVNGIYKLHERERERVQERKKEKEQERERENKRYGDMEIVDLEIAIKM